MIAITVTIATTIAITIANPIAITIAIPALRITITIPIPSTNVIPILSAKESAYMERMLFVYQTLIPGCPPVCLPTMVYNPSLHPQGGLKLGKKQTVCVPKIQGPNRKKWPVVTRKGCFLCAGNKMEPVYIL